MRTLLLLRGAPGSGKSTWIRENNLEQYTLEADSFRQLISNPIMTLDGEYRITQDSDRLAWDMLYKALEHRMRRGDFTIIDATHATKTSMQDYKKLIEQYRYRVYYKTVDCSLEELLERNQTRPEHKRIPEEGIRQKYALLQTNDVPNFATEINDLSEIDNFYTMDANKYKDIKVIGDVQGCYTVLMEALSDFNPETLYIFAGDLLDRGIENDKVLQWAFEHAKDPNVIFIRGNHDVHLENWAFEALDENGDPIKLPHVFNYKTRPQLLGQKDYEQYEIGLRVNDEATDLYYAVNDQITDIPVFWYKDKLVEKPRMTFRDGYVHLIDPYQVRHNTNYSTFTVDEFKLKKRTRDLIRRFRDAVALEFHGRKYFINHAGISALPKMTFIPSFQLIRGVGKYETQIDEIWEESFQKGNTQGFIQVHGHRHTDSTEHSICLEDNVEYGGNLCVLHITENGHSVQKYANTVFRIPQTDTESDSVAKPWIVDTANPTTNSMIRNKHIRVKSLDHNLYSLNFTSRAFEKGIWDTETVKARGLFVDQTTGNIKMRSYNKFFAIGEQEETQISNLKKSVKFPLIAHKKYNGFLGIASTINGEFVLATKSTTEGEYVDYFREIFDQLTQNEKDQLKDLSKKYDCSFTFEVEHTSDRHIIDFDKNSLTILDAIPNSFEFNGIDIDSAFSNNVLDQLKITSPFFKRKEVIATFDDIPTLMRYIKEHDYDRDSEGLVLTDQNGFMFKVKYAYYREVKRLRGLHENAIKSLRTSTAIKLNKAITDVQVRFLNWLRDKDNAYIFETHIIDIFRDFEKDCGKQL